MDATNTFQKCLELPIKDRQNEMIRLLRQMHYDLEAHFHGDRQGALAKTKLEEAALWICMATPRDG